MDEMFDGMDDGDVVCTGGQFDGFDDVVLLSVALWELFKRAASLRSSARSLLRLYTTGIGHEVVVNCINMNRMCSLGMITTGEIEVA